MNRHSKNVRPVLVLAFVFLTLALRAGAASAHWIVVSDIDDTIRETGVVKDIRPADPGGARPKNYVHLLGDPFRACVAVPGMAARYQQWRAHDHAEFVYLSRGPWFYRWRLAGFLRAGGFPSGRICLSSFFPFTPARFKDTALNKFLRAQPGSAFVFIGDSGESDPETYSRVASDPKHLHAIRGIFIREVTPRDPSLRCRLAFAGVPCSVFTQAAQLPAALDRSAKLPARHVQTSHAHRR